MVEIQSPNRRPRIWPAVCVLALAGLALAGVWAWPEMQRQQRYLRAASILIITCLALLFWFLFFSRLRWPVRLGGFAAFVLIGAALGFSFQIRGVDGDLLPIVEPRWKTRHAIAPPAVTSPSPPTTHASASPTPEFPQFYGPYRNGVVPGVELETNWVNFPPQVLWKRPVGPSWSGFVVKDGLAITQEQRGENECVIAYDLLTGNPAWTHSDPARYSTTIAGEGPRSTPAIVRDRVFTFGGTGLLNCLDLRTGRPIWSKDTARENEASLPDWGFTSSPLVVDDQVILSVGGSKGRSLVAYAVADGSQAWADGAGGTDYSSPLEATLLGTRQIIVFGSSLVGRDLNGQQLWTYPWPGGHPHVTAPLIVSSNQFFASTGYGTGCELVSLELDSTGTWKASREWKSMALKSKFGPVFHSGGHIYGFDDGIFACVDLKTGERKWKEGRFGHGQGLLVGGLILLTSEKGEIILISPNPEKLVEIARLKVFADKTWNPPALAGDYLLVRNDKEAACLQLKTRQILSPKAK